MIALIYKLLNYFLPPDISNLKKYKGKIDLDIDLDEIRARDRRFNFQDSQSS